LESAVASGATSFDFAGDRVFAWDRMYVFDCYSSRASVEKALGFAWPDFSKTTIESSDSVVLVVFVQNAKVVGWFEQPRTIELGHLANEKGYARSEAVFEVDRGTGRVELKPQTAVRAPATHPVTAPAMHPISETKEGSLEKFRELRSGMTLEQTRSLGFWRRLTGGA